MKILLCNDDGVDAQGLYCLAQTLKSIADIEVIAPDRDRSGASNSLTLANPLRVTKRDNGFYSVQGTPTDCVHLALSGLFKDKFDLIVSGINSGSNMGDDVFYSGTVAAAIEGYLMGYPAIAVSLSGKNKNLQNYQTAATVIKELINSVSHQDFFKKRMVLNINVPDVVYKKLASRVSTRLGKRHCSEPILPSLDPRGKTIYWIGPTGKEADSGVGTDFYAVKNNQVSITPLQLDLTNYSVFSEINAWLKN